MISIKDNLQKLRNELPIHVTLVVVTKTQSAQNILEVYNSGYKIFGENKVQELIEKQQKLPKDIEWHLIGHLQTNKVKYIAPFIKLIHSVDSLKLLKEINYQAIKNNRIIKCLFQIFIAKEETKFGFEFQEAKNIIESKEFEELKNIEIIGLMGMASNTNNQEQINEEFNSLKLFYNQLKSQKKTNVNLQILSMGMSSDYQLAIEQGSTMIRVGSLIFGERKKN